MFQMNEERSYNSLTKLIKEEQYPIIDRSIQTSKENRTNAIFSPVSKKEVGSPTKEQLRSSLSSVSTSSTSLTYDRSIHEMSPATSEENRIRDSFFKVEGSVMGEILNSSVDMAGLFPRNSDSLQLKPSSYSIWRGCIWSKIIFDIEVASSFFLDESAYILIPSIESPMFKDLLDSTNSQLVKFEFLQNEVSIHQDLFSSGDTFKLVMIILKDKGSSDHNLDPSLGEFIYYCKSEQIDVTDYAICIEHRFDKSPYISRIIGSEFSWFNKCGGEHSGLDVMIHLRDEKGRIVNDINETIYMKTELIYPDGKPAPYLPLNPLKERRSEKISNTPLYNPLRPEPILIPGQTSIYFSFRIEEVSFRHPNQGGFKLKVSQLGPSRYTIHSGVMEETVIVLSKPNIDTASQTKRRGRSLLPEGLEQHKKVILTENLNGSMPLATFMSCFMNEMGQCRGCKKHIPANIFSFVSNHDSSCIFNTKLWHFMDLFPHLHSHITKQKPLAEIRSSNDIILSGKIEKKKRSVSFHPEEPKSSVTKQNISTNVGPFTPEKKDTKGIKSSAEKVDFNNITLFDFDYQEEGEMVDMDDPFYEWMGEGRF